MKAAAQIDTNLGQQRHVLKPPQTHARTHAIKRDADAILNAFC